MVNYKTRESRGIIASQPVASKQAREPPGGVGDFTDAMLSSGRIASLSFRPKHHFLNWNSMQKRTLLVFALFMIAAAFLPQRRALTSPSDFDLIISRGHVVDGAGNPWIEADVAVKDGRIAE